MKKIRFFAFCMAFLMFLSAFMSTSFLTAFAAQEEEEIPDYTTIYYKTPELKLAAMDKVYSKHGLELYYHSFTGEVAIKDVATGQILFTNPYNLGSTGISPTVKQKVLSQIIMKYTVVGSNTETEFNSYNDAALNEGIIMSLIKGGIRVEYTLGVNEKRKLVPRMISAERFESLILANFDPNVNKLAYKKITSFFQKRDPNDPDITPKLRQEILKKFPITSKFPIYVLTSDVKAADLNTLQSYIKQYTSYTMQDLLADHEECGYTMEDTSPPLFKMALEYTVDEEGLVVRLPARGIQFDSATYKLSYISVLPYFGAGNSKETGYNFIPDGSGTLVRFEDLGSKAANITGKLYGNDFGFHTVSSGTMETWRLPVYGTIRDTVVIRERMVPALDADGNERYDANGNLITKREQYEDKKTEGYMAIILEGDSLTEITSQSGGPMHIYHSVFTTVYPRQKDSYPLDGITVSGATATYEVDAARKYVGNYTIRYKLLSGDSANYVTMAKLYREYLENNGVLKRTTEAGDIPLYLETLGAIDTIQRVFGMPVSVKTSLTTFEQAQTILKELMDSGITNLILKYTGWNNGGLDHTPPSKLSVESALGGNSGLEDLVKFIKDNQLGFYPDFDFVYVYDTGIWDGFDMDEDTLKTIEGKVAILKKYSFVTQTFESTSLEIISSNNISRFYKNIREKYLDFGIGSISVSTLGDALNTDHNEDYPLNREDAKEKVIEFFETLKADQQSIMTSYGNSYIYKFVDHILDAPLDSSSRLLTSEDVPFLGMVLHGYISFTGEAINLAGDYEYNLLKTLENGANPYFLLSYENTSELKNTEFSNYYSVDYSIWKEDLIAEYNKLNSALKGVKNSLIVGHEFIESRVVCVTYDNGTSFVLNYNNYPVTIDGETIDAMGFIVK